MVERMARRVQQLVAPVAEREARAVLGDLDPVGRHPDEPAVEAVERRVAVDRARRRLELRRIHQMRDAARMHDHARARQSGGERAGAAGMIEVHVRQHDRLDRGRLELASGQGGEQARHRGRGSGIDERGGAVGDDQVTRVEPRAHVMGVDREHAVADFADVLDHGFARSAVVGH